MIKVKQGKRGAVIKVMPTEMLAGLIRAEVIFAANGHDLVITEWWRKIGNDSSFHPVHYAVDIRAKNILPGHRKLILQDLKAAMDRQFDFILHGKGSSIHFHMEYQPKQLPKPRSTHGLG